MSGGVRGRENIQEEYHSLDSLSAVDGPIGVAYCTDVYHDVCGIGKEKPPKFIAGIMISRKGSTFMRLLYESYRNNYRPWDWDYNCARVAYQLYVQRPDLLHVEPYRFTTPDWQDRDKLWNQVIDWSELYVIHVMGHFSYDSYTPQSICLLYTSPSPRDS